MSKIYSIKKGLSKGVLAMLTMIAGVLAFSGFGDFTIWQLLESYVKPLTAGVTVAGLVGMAINYIKFKFVSTE